MRWDRREVSRHTYCRSKRLDAVLAGLRETCAAADDGVDIGRRLIEEHRESFLGYSLQEVADALTFLHLFVRSVTETEYVLDVGCVSLALLLHTKVKAAFCCGAAIFRPTEYFLCTGCEVFPCVPLCLVI